MSIYRLLVMQYGVAIKENCWYSHVLNNIPDTNTMLLRTAGTMIDCEFVQKITWNKAFVWKQS